ncbi:MAG: diaminopimelate epimerase [Deltaproteobacteria bacterium]|nr:diaminopimelate epimerase [Deltaproteobacteria bacterium]
MRKGIPFSKLNGSGNDFLVVDNRRGILRGVDLPALVGKVCDRSRSIGADGMIFIEKSRRADFRWQFYNADGSRAEMCGNGGRCAARYAVERRIARRKLAFETDAGLIRAEVSGRRVKLQMVPPHGLALSKTLTLGGRKIAYSFLNTGVPHAVLFVPDLSKIDLPGTGRRIRTHRAFAPRGTNVNFVKVKDGTVWVRTYERGVEGETLACGTGAVACGILSAVHGYVRPPVSVRTRGGEVLTIHFDLEKKGFGEVYLEGDTSWSCDGLIFEEAYRY